MTNLALFISSFHAQSATATEHVCLCCRTFTKLSLNSTLKMLRVCSKWVYNPRPFITVPCGFFWNMRRENWKVLLNPSHLFHNSQEPILFAISARENIAFGVEELKKKHQNSNKSHLLKLELWLRAGLFFMSWNQSAGFQEASQIKLEEAAKLANCDDLKGWQLDL